MDISLIQEFKECINSKFDNIILNIIEQYNSEIKKLEEVILSSTQMIHEKEDLIKQLNEKLDENSFNEDNFNKFSIISNLNKQVNELSKKNEVLEISLRARKNSMERKYNTSQEDDDNKNGIDHDVVEENRNKTVGNEVVLEKDTETVEHNDVVQNEVGVERNTETAQNVSEELTIEVSEIEHKEDTSESSEVVTEVEHKEDTSESSEVVTEVEHKEDTSESSEVVAEVIAEETTEVDEVENNDEEDNIVEELTEDEIEVEEIVYKEKTYYLKDNMLYNKKKNGDMGKEVGKMVNGKPKLNKKKKKNKE
jgi:hypothetical protein